MILPIQIFVNQNTNVRYMILFNYFNRLPKVREKWNNEKMVFNGLITQNFVFSAITVSLLALNHFWSFSRSRYVWLNRDLEFFQMQNSFVLSANIRISSVVDSGILLTNIMNKIVPGTDPFDTPL